MDQPSAPPSTPAPASFPDDPAELAALLRAAVDGLSAQVDPLIEHWAIVRDAAQPQSPEQWAGAAFLDRKLGNHRGVDLTVLADAVEAAENSGDSLELLRTRVSYALARAAAGDQLALEEARYLVERIAVEGTLAEAANAWARLARSEPDPARQTELLDGAAGLYRRARDPEWATICLMEAAAVTAERDLVDAKVFLARAEELCPPGLPTLRAGLHETRGQIAGQEGDYDETRAQWELALSIADGHNPRYVSALRLRMCPLYQGLGDHEALAWTVVQLIDDAVLHGDDPSLHAARDYAEVAVAELYAALDEGRAEEVAPVASLLAALLDRLGQADDADEVLRRYGDR